MVKLTIPVCVNNGDADVEILVSNRDAQLLKRFCNDEAYDSPEDVEELEDVCERLRRKILRGLAEQVEDCEDISEDDFDFFFSFPEFGDEE